MSGPLAPGAAAGPIEAAFAGTLGSFRLDVAFRIPGAGVTAVFGPSGSGKTTILRCIAGLQRLAGRFLIGGETWQDDGRGAFRAPHERRIGYVFQEASLFPHLPVRGNLLYGARRAGVAPALGFDAVVDMLGLGLLLQRAPAALSGGERQRVAVGRALLSQPRLLLMDEPLSALDQGAREEIISCFEVLHRELSIPMLYVSHDLAEVARLADHLVVVAGGAKLADGPVGEILERLDLHPTAERFEAGVVLDARVVAHERRYHLSRLRHHRQLITVPLVEAEVGETVRLRIRARRRGAGHAPAACHQHPQRAAGQGHRGPRTAGHRLRGGARGHRRRAAARPRYPRGGRRPEAARRHARVRPGKEHLFRAARPALSSATRI